MNKITLRELEFIKKVDHDTFHRLMVLCGCCAICFKKRSSIEILFVPTDGAHLSYIFRRMNTSRHEINESIDSIDKELNRD